MQTKFTPSQLERPEIAASEPILRKCVHCGFCTATCPTYVLLGDELDSPRGRIYLIKDMLENDRPATAEVVKHLDRCLSCLSCMTGCPSGVHYQHLIDGARAHVERTYRRPWRDRALRTLLAQVLPYPRRLRLALLAAALVRPFAAALPEPLRAMLALADRGRARMPRETAPRASREAPLHAPSDAQADIAASAAASTAQRRTRVAVLQGCVQSVVAREIEAATLRLLERAGADVVAVPGCCGAIVHHLGIERDAETHATALIERLHAAIENDGVDFVVANASGCGTHVKDYGYLFRNDARLAARAARVSERARDVSEALTALGLPPAQSPLSPRPTVVYQSACSLNHGQRVDEAPRALLEQAGYEVRVPAEAHLCCGSAGTYNVLEPEIAGRLRARKLDRLGKTGAEVIATGNVGCLLQLRAGAMPVVHTVELLDWATGGPEPHALQDARMSGARTSIPHK
jgi:glycolate oxidase iron-sulfur subunit